MLELGTALERTGHQMDKSQEEAGTGADGAGAASARTKAEAIHAVVVEALKTVFDPEIPVNIYDLGLIYRIDVIDRRLVDIDMTLTAPGCPVAGELLNMARRAVEAVPAVEGVKVSLVFDPPWHRSMMSDEAKLDLGFFD